MANTDFSIRNKSSTEVLDFLLTECSKEIIVKYRFLEMYDLLEEIEIDPYGCYRQIDSRISEKLFKMFRKEIEEHDERINMCKHSAMCKRSERSDRDVPPKGIANEVSEDIDDFINDTLRSGALKYLYGILANTA